MSKKKGTSWVEKKDIYSDVTDEGFFAHWTDFVEAVSKKMLFDYGLPASNLDDFISDGFRALAMVPRDARWNACYVKTAVRNKLITQLKSAQKRWSRLEYRGELPDDFASHDGMHDGVVLAALVAVLDAGGKQIVALYLQGYTEKESAALLGVEPQEIKTRMEAALATMQAHAARVLVQ